MEADSMSEATDAIPEDALPELDDAEEQDITRMSFTVTRLTQQRKRPAKKRRG